MSMAFLKILAFPNKALSFVGILFQTSIPRSLIHFYNRFDTEPRSPITGIMITFLNPHNRAISLFKSWYFSIFSCSFSCTLLYYYDYDYDYDYYDYYDDDDDDDDYYYYYCYLMAFTLWQMLYRI